MLVVPESSPIAHGVSDRRRFYLHDLGAKVPEKRAHIRTGEELAKLHRLQSLERSTLKALATHIGLLADLPGRAHSLLDSARQNARRTDSFAVAHKPVCPNQRKELFVLLSLGGG